MSTNDNCFFTVNEIRPIPKNVLEINPRHPMDIRHESSDCAVQISDHLLQVQRRGSMAGLQECSGGSLSFSGSSSPAAQNSICFSIPHMFQEPGYWSMWVARAKAMLKTGAIAFWATLLPIQFQKVSLNKSITTHTILRRIASTESRNR